MKNSPGMISAMPENGWAMKPPHIFAMGHIGIGFPSVISLSTDLWLLGAVKLVRPLKGRLTIHAHAFGLLVLHHD